jgi:cytochrome c-type biogenesis protein CcmH
MLFWVAALICSAIAVFYVVRPLALARKAAQPRAAHDAQVFRDQLVEVDNDLERGVLTEEQARAARIEISRRLLAADAERQRHADHQPAPALASAALALALLVGAPLGTYALYQSIGAPGMPDQPIAARATGQRPGQAIAETRLGQPAPPVEDVEAADLIRQLEERLAGDDPDPQGLFLLARSYSQLGRYGEAWRTYRRLVDSQGGDAPGTVYTAMAESMIIAANGYVSPEAEAALEEALRREPGNPIARYYMGATQVQLDQPRAALDLWTGVLRDSPADAPWVPATIARIEETVEQTGLPMPDLSTRPVPDEAEQGRMMADLVTKFEARLLQEGGTVDEWVQLVRSYEALGAAEDTARARANALSAFGEDTEAVEAFQQALATGPDGAAAHGTDDLRATVETLDARLAEEGGTAGAWLRLITSWRALGEEEQAIAAEARARADLEGRPGQLAALDGGLGNVPTAGLRGPSEEDVAAAAEMTPEDRAMMIRGMVEGLQMRLFEDGGTPEDWARLIRSYAIIGEAAQAAEAFRRGIEDHAGDRAAQSFIREAAVVSGVDTE